MTLLQLVQAACGEMGLPQPNAVASSTDLQVLQILALMNKVGSDIITNENWEGLDKEYRFNTVVYSLTGTTTSGSAIVTGISSTSGITASTFMCTGTGIPADTYVNSVDSSAQVTLSNPATNSGTSTLVFTQTKYSMPSDFDRVVNRTQWDKTNHWELMGPKSPQEWQYLKGGIVATGPRMRYRIRQGYFEIWPPTTTASQLGFEYISTGWVNSASGTAKSSFTADDDTCIFRDRTMIAGVKFEFYNIKGFDTTSLSRDYYMQVQKEMAMDHAAPTLSLAASNAPMFISPGSIPESGYGT
jgi:hypothetical protein